MRDRDGEGEEDKRGRKGGVSVSIKFVIFSIFIDVGVWHIQTNGVPFELEKLSEVKCQVVIHGDAVGAEDLDDFTVFIFKIYELILTHYFLLNPEGDTLRSRHGCWNTNMPHTIPCWMCSHARL